MKSNWKRYCRGFMKRLKLSLEKCQFYQTSFSYLGHVASTEGFVPDLKKVKAVISWPRPNVVMELRYFLVFCTYYPKFVEGFAEIVWPKNEDDDGAVPKPFKLSKGLRIRQESIREQWTEHNVWAFVQLKRSLTNAPVLTCTNPSKPHELHIDIRKEYDGHLRPVAYESRSLTPAERNYPTHKLELLALK